MNGPVLYHKERTRFLAFVAAKKVEQVITSVLGKTYTHTMDNNKKQLVVTYPIHPDEDFTFVFEWEEVG